MIKSIYLPLYNRRMYATSTVVSSSKLSLALKGKWIANQEMEKGRGRVFWPSIMKLLMRHKRMFYWKQL